MSITKDFLGGHATDDTQRRTAAEDQISPAAKHDATPRVRTSQGNQTPQAGTMRASIPDVHPSRLADPLLALLADVLDDLERTRIANDNRLRQLTRTEADSDGETRGFGLPADMPQVAALAAIVEGMGKLEHDAELNLKRALRKHPLGAWIKTTNGVGEKQGARLLAALGDPYWNTLYDRPRTVSELWAYCGLHVLPAAGQARLVAHQGGTGSGDQTHPDHGTVDSQESNVRVLDRGDPDQTRSEAHRRCVGVAPTRARGQRANWSATAKMRAFLVAESCVKVRTSPYRAVYDDGRAKYADAIHQVDCRRCGPAGKPALTGTPLSLGHQHARALRLVMKAILKDLWLQARDIHGGGAA